MNILIGVFFLLVSELFSVNINSFKANFEQIITSKNNKAVYKGEVYLSKSDKLKIFWKYETPIDKKIYIINKDVVIIEPELEQAIKTKIDSKFDLLSIINGANQISKNRYKTALNNTDYYLFFDKGKLIKITYQDELNNNVVILFSKQVQNIPIKTSVFNYTIPKYFDIIDK